jgi:hypothetical protein
MTWRADLHESGGTPSIDGIVHRFSKCHPEHRESASDLDFAVACLLAVLGLILPARAPTPRAREFRLRTAAARSTTARRRGRPALYRAHRLPRRTRQGRCAPTATAPGHGRAHQVSSKIRHHSSSPSGWPPPRPAVRTGVRPRRSKTSHPLADAGAAAAHSAIAAISCRWALSRLGRLGNRGPQRRGASPGRDRGMARMTFRAAPAAPGRMSIGALRDLLPHRSGIRSG